MKVKIKYIVLAFILAQIYSCAKDDIEFGTNVNPIVVNGIFVAGEKPVITLNLLGTYNGTNQTPVTDAFISILSSNSKYIFTLSNSNTGEYTYPGNDLQIIAGNTYQLEITHAGNIIFAETIIPYPAANIELGIEKIEFQDSLQNSDTISFLNINWDTDNNTFFYTVLDCDSVNPVADNYCNYIINDELPYTENYQFIDMTGLIYGNKYKVIIYSMTDEYAAYFYNYETVGSDFGYSGNITNAYGIFTGLSSSSVTFQYFPDSVPIVAKQNISLKE